MMRQESTFFGSEARILVDNDKTEFIKDIAATQTCQDEPFYVLDAEDIFRKVKNWKLKMPRVKMFYAVKCNNNPTVLQMLASLGVNFDCASKNEMHQVLNMGVDPSRVIFAHPCKPASHLKFASKAGIEMMTFDNEVELHKIKAMMPNAKLLIRIRCDAVEAQAPLGVKFGVHPHDAQPLIKVASELGLNLVGVAFHVGSGCKEPEVFDRAIREARNTFDVAEEYGFKLRVLDIGGGFPGVAGSVSLDTYADIINAALDYYFPEESGVKIMAEPGRYVVASAFTLVTSIISKRDSPDTTMYYINDGVYGSFNCILYDHQEVTTVALKDPRGELPKLPCSIWGPTCDGLDEVLSSAYLPQLSIGDVLYWPDMGAYTLAAAGTFNGFSIPKVYVGVSYPTLMFFDETEHMSEELLTRKICSFSSPNDDHSENSYHGNSSTNSYHDSNYSDNSRNVMNDQLPFLDVAEM